MTTLTFSQLGLSEAILKATVDMDFTQTSSIQAEAIPHILMGTDIIAKAPTGSGKTAAFAIPILEKLDFNPENKNVQALILCPTRELTMQVQKEFEKLRKYIDNCSVVSVYGGQQIDKQLNALKKNPQIVVATPGRLMDLLKRGAINLQLISMVVLDEADEMLDMGFRDDINFILEGTPENKQTILFSATMAKDIMELTKKFQKNPKIVDVTGKKQDKPDIEQLYFEVVQKDKPELITRLLNLHNVKLALVFCNTKSSVDLLVEVLKRRGYLADSLHGDLNQTQREKVMGGFRNGSVQILVATDVAGRGIDVKNIEAVFNYDLPRDDEDYIHRIGRTARAGCSGTAFTFVSKRELQSLKRIERANGMLIHKNETPTIEQLDVARFNTYSLKIKNSIEKDDLTNCYARIQAMEDQGIAIKDVAAALFKIVLDQECKKIDDSVVFAEDDYSDNKRSGRGGARGRFSDRRPSRSGFGGRSRGESSGTSRKSGSYGRKSESSEKTFEYGEKSSKNADPKAKSWDSRKKSSYKPKTESGEKSFDYRDKTGMSPKSGESKKNSWGSRKNSGFKGKKTTTTNN